jgi:ABC-2 type transport system ATP-binding protein
MIDDQTNVVEIRNLTRRFGSHIALNNVSLSVPPGCVFGLIGENGAGKTTLIKHVLGLLKAQEGSVTVFGSNPVTDPVGILSKIGYLSEENDIPGWMRIDELEQYTQSFYPGWDQRYADELRRTFALEPNMVVRNLSRGQRARAGLLVALSYRPDLLVFDEPSSGLDPLVRRDILGAIVRTIAEDGRTVFFSSHLLGEVERVADYVAMVKEGEIVFSDSLLEIKNTHYQATLRFAEPINEPPPIASALSWEGQGKEWTSIFTGDIGDADGLASALNATVVSLNCPSLDEIFVARATDKVLLTAHA